MLWDKNVFSIIGASRQ